MTIHEKFLDAVYAASKIHRPPAKATKVVAYSEKVTTAVNFTEPVTHLCDVRLGRIAESFWDGGPVYILTTEEVKHINNLRQYLYSESRRASKSFIQRMSLTRSQRKACRHFHPLFWKKTITTNGIVFTPTIEEQTRAIALLDGPWQTVPVEYPQDFIESGQDFILFWTNGLSSPAGSWYESDISYQIGPNRSIRWSSRDHFAGNTAYTLFVPEN